MDLTLKKALRVQPASCIAFVGAGGKSTAMFKLANEFSSAVIVTTTAHLGVWQIPLADIHIITDIPTPIEQLGKELNGVILVTGEIEKDRVKPVDNKLLRWLYSFCRSRSIPLLIEADGSRQKPLKAWAEHEPPIPEFTDHVVQVVGMSGLGKPLTDEFVHRVDIFSKLSGLASGEAITTEALAKVMTHKDGVMKNIPPDAGRSVILNQADAPDGQSIAHMMIDALLPRFQAIVIASLKNGTIHAVHESIAGIILAAGESSRFGKPKQLIDWKGEPFVRVVAKTAIRAGLSPAIVVTGANAEEVEMAVRDLNVTIVHNNQWKSGQGSSMREGISAIPDECGGAIFLLADQPQMNTSILHALKEKHANGLNPIIAPMVIDRRANPVLFDRVTFADLMNIEGDIGGRAIFHMHRIEYLPWHDDALLLDVDTPEQYQKIVSNEDI